MEGATHWPARPRVLPFTRGTGQHVDAGHIVAIRPGSVQVVPGLGAPSEDVHAYAQIAVARISTGLPRWSDEGQSPGHCHTSRSANPTSKNCPQARTSRYATASPADTTRKTRDERAQGDEGGDDNGGPPDADGLVRKALADGCGDEEAGGIGGLAMQKGQERAFTVVFVDAPLPNPGALHADERVVRHLVSTAVPLAEDVLTRSLARVISGVCLPLELVLHVHDQDAHSNVRHAECEDLHGPRQAGRRVGTGRPKVSAGKIPGFSVRFHPRILKGWGSSLAVVRCACGAIVRCVCPTGRELTQHRVRGRHLPACR